MKVLCFGEQWILGGSVKIIVVLYQHNYSRNPRSITRLKTYLSNTISEEAEVDLDFMNNLDNNRLARINREGKGAKNSYKSKPAFIKPLKTKDENNATTNFIEDSSDYISEIAGQILHTLENLVGAGNMLEICSEALACKAKTFLPKLPSSGMLPDTKRCEELKESNNMCNRLKK